MEEVLCSEDILKMPSNFVKLLGVKDIDFKCLFEVNPILCGWVVDAIEESNQEYVDEVLCAIGGINSSIVAETEDNWIEVYDEYRFIFDLGRVDKSYGILDRVGRELLAEGVLLSNHEQDLSKLREVCRKLADLLLDYLNKSYELQEEDMQYKFYDLYSNEDPRVKNLYIDLDTYKVYGVVCEVEPMF